jgi:hypothetical protein
LEPRVSVFPFFNSGAFFGRLPFALLVLQFRAAETKVFKNGLDSVEVN